MSRCVCVCVCVPTFLEMVSVVEPNLRQQTRPPGNRAQNLRTSPPTRSRGKYMCIPCSCRGKWATYLQKDCRACRELENLLEIKPFLYVVHAKARGVWGIIQVFSIPLVSSELLCHKYIVISVISTLFLRKKITFILTQYIYQMGRGQPGECSLYTWGGSWTGKRLHLEDILYLVQIAVAIHGTGLPGCSFVYVAVSEVKGYILKLKKPCPSTCVSYVV